MNGFQRLFSQFDGYNRVLVLSANFTFINCLLNSTSENHLINVISATDEWENLESRKESWDLILYFDAPEIWERDVFGQLPESLVDKAKVIFASFPSPASGELRGNWPSFYNQTLNKHTYVQTSTYYRKYFWTDELVPVTFVQSLLVYSKTEELIKSDFPLDCVHPVVFASRNIPTVASSVNSKLRVKIASLIPASRRRQIIALLPAGFSRKIRRWIRS